MENSDMPKIPICLKPRYPKIADISGARTSLERGYLWSADIPHRFFARAPRARHTHINESKHGEG